MRVILNVNLQFKRFQYGRKKIQDHDSKYTTEPAEESTTSRKVAPVEDTDKKPEDIDGDDDSEDADPGRLCITYAQITLVIIFHKFAVFSGGSKRGARDPPPPTRPKFLYFPCSFLGLAHPPLGNPGSATGISYISKLNHKHDNMA